MADYQFLARKDLQRLIDVLRQSGFRCIGPQLRDGAIIYDTLDDVAQLPRGVRDRQAPGSYRIEQHDDERLFAWANGPQAIKPRTFAPREILWHAHYDDGALNFSAGELRDAPLAVIGARACDLAALGIHDAHFLHNDVNDAFYAARRGRLFLVAVNCSHPAATCFCASTGDGPTAEAGYDLRLDELDDGFLVHAASPVGGRVMEDLFLPEADKSHRITAEHQRAAAAAAQSRSLPSTNLRGALFDNLEHPRWQEVAARCLSCGNCTAVCPTCFCHSERDEPSLDGKQSAHYRQWDSCFTEGHSYIHGFVIRADTRLRYRQWMTHKLGSWHDQYGRSGCVGCGRCISWCPAAIDLTEEATAICS